MLNGSMENLNRLTVRVSGLVVDVNGVMVRSHDLIVQPLETIIAFLVRFMISVSVLL
jgi:hypothetical protein